jgi:hypothetical protein
VTNRWDPPTPSPDEMHTIGISLRGAFEDSGKAAAEELGSESFSFDTIIEQAETYGEERGAELIGMKIVDGQLVENPNAEWAISDTTRDRVNELLQDALDEGESYQKFSDRLEESGLFDEARADLIARTEIALAMAGGKVAVYREMDVDYVVLMDENNCGEDVCDVDGDVVSIEEYEASPLGHPNCTRDARPATQAELAEEGLLGDDETDAEAEAA